MADLTWDGAQDQATWEDGRNWGGAEAAWPKTNNDKAIIPAALAHTIVTTGDVTIGELDIQTGCTATLTLGGSLDIEDGGTENGALTIEENIIDTDDNDLTIAGLTAIGGGGGAVSSAQVVCGSSDVDLNGALTIAADGEFSAPDSSGSWLMGDAFTNISGIITHNDGTLTWDGNAGMLAGSTNVTLFDLVIPNGGVLFNRMANVTIENSVTVQAGGSILPSSPVSRNTALTLGTTTKSCTFVNNNTVQIGGNSGTNVGTIQAADSNYPVICTGNDWDWDAFVDANGVIIKDLDYRIAATTGGGGVTLVSTRCLFPLGMVISSGDVVKIAANTASGFHSIEGAGTLQVARGGGVYIVGGIGEDAPLPIALPTVLNPPHVTCDFIERVDS